VVAILYFIYILYFQIANFNETHNREGGSYFIFCCACVRVRYVHMHKRNEIISSFRGG
jgi:hypothetical protein